MHGQVFFGLEKWVSRHESLILFGFAGGSGWTHRVLSINQRGAVPRIHLFPKIWLYDSEEGSLSRGF